MTLEQVEVQISDLLTKAKQVQLKAQQIQRQSRMVAMQSEVLVREKFNDYFEEALTLLGKGILKGRKIKEALIAETQRKTASLRKAKAHKAFIPKAVARKSKARYKKHVTHSTTAARAQ